MNLEYKHLLNPSFDDNSRVWIYQCSRTFSLAEAFEIEDRLNIFVANWNSHGAPVKGESHLFFGQFIILIADETATTIGGCSTDSSMRMIKEIEAQYKVHLFDRTTFAFVVKEKLQLLPLSQLDYGYQNDFINQDSLYFNNLVATKKEFAERWIIPIKESWLAGKLKLTEAS